MPNSVFQALARERVDAFRSAFNSLSTEAFYDEEEGRLRHSAEFGAYRERICADFLKLFIPSYLRTGSGFLINKADKVSTQCDIVIYDPQFTPTVEDADNRRFFPVETVAAIGEVKSKLKRSDLLDALVKLARIKALRNVEGKSPFRRTQSLQFEEQGHHYDDAVSFLICEKFDFGLNDITAIVSRHYDKNDVELRHRHNFVLSVNDGILCYKNHLMDRNLVWAYPFTRGERMKNRFLSPGKSGRNHFLYFTAYLFMVCVNATIYLPELRDYDTKPSEGEYQDEN